MIKNDIGIIGYGIMSQNISFKLSKNYFISIFNKEKIFIKKKVSKIFYTNNLNIFLNSIKNNKIIFLLIKTGKPINIIIKKLKNKLFKKDIIIDFGNSYFKDTYLNYKYIKKKFVFISSGISGGYLGALNGLCIMLDCNIRNFKEIFFIIKNISLKIKKKYNYYISEGYSSSHYLKMIHNGIEYALLQIISEIYLLLKILLFKKKKIINILIIWNNKELNSFLLKLLINIILKKKLKICDSIEEKGTGKWMCIHALKNSININNIFDSLIIRIISKDKFIRKILKNNKKNNIKGNFFIYIEKIKKIFLISNIFSYIQGFNQILLISKKYNWYFNLKNLMKSFLNSCIIQSFILIKFIKLKNNFFYSKYLFILFKKYYFFFIEIINNFNNLSVTLIVLFSCLNFLLILINKINNFKLIQFQRNYFGNHLLKKI